MNLKSVLAAATALVALGLVVGTMGWTSCRHSTESTNPYDVRSEGILRVGDLAPNVELSGMDGQGTRRISELWRESPLVLVFGSYT